MKKIKDELAEVQRKIEPLINSDEERKAFVEYVAKYNQYVKHYDDMLRLIKEGKRSEAEQIYLNESLKTFDEAFKSGVDLTNFKFERGNQAVAQNGENFRSSLRWVVGMLLAVSAACLSADRTGRPCSARSSAASRRKARRANTGRLRPRRLTRSEEGPALPPNSCPRCLLHGTTFLNRKRGAVFHALPKDVPEPALTGA